MSRKGTGWIAAGLLLIAAGLALTGFNQLQSRRAGEAAQVATVCLEEAVQTRALELERDYPALSLPASAQSAAEEPQPEMPVQTIGGVDYIGLLSIPALELELPIISLWDDASGLLAPCRYSGTVYSADFVICGHNYRSHFGQLKQLSLGDRITFTDVDGGEYSYEVASLETLLPSEVEAMTHSGWDLTLFTCTTGAQSRLAIRCEKVAQGND